jgi:3-phenylpropionate/trans-cinnamate dioxygenase ferredoxin reductase subunit
MINTLEKFELVVVGASAAAEALTAELSDLNYEGKVLVIDQDSRMPYERPPLSKNYLTSNSEIDITVDWDLNVDFVNAHATAIDAESNKLHFEVIADKKKGFVEFGKLVIATGASPFHLPIEPEGVLSLRTINDSEEIGQSARKTKSVGIIGAGAIGVELATSLREIGAEVTLFDKATGPIERLLAGHLGETVTSWLDDLGVKCEFNVDLEEITRIDDTWVVAIGDSRSLNFGTLISAVGARPSVQWLESSNILSNSQLICDDLGRVISPTGIVENIYAAGDVVTRKSVTGDLSRTESWTAAAEQGKQLAEHIAGVEISEKEEPYFWTDVAGRKIQVFGHLEAGSVLEVVREDPDRDATLFKAVSPTGVLGWIGINSPQAIAKIRMGIQD